MIDDRVNPNESVSNTSLSLLERIKAKDEVAWGRLRDLYSPLVYRWCRQAGVADAEIPDLGQEVFLAVARGIASFRRDRAGDTFRGWLRTITRHKIADLGRKNAGHLGAAGGSDAQKAFAEVPFEIDVSDDAKSIAQETSLLYARALEIVAGEFPDWYTVAFVRFVIDDHRPADIAKDLGKRPSAIYNVKSRVLQRLRIEFGEIVD